MPVRWKHPFSYATVHRREGKLPYPIPCRDLSCGVCREARKLTGGRRAFSNRLLSCIHAISQFVSIGLKNREFVWFPPRIFDHMRLPWNGGVKGYVRGGALSAR